MNLHLQAQCDVLRVLGQHGTCLTYLRGFLDQAVQELGGFWEEPLRPDLADIDPGIRAGSARVLAGARLPAGSSLRPVMTSFGGLHLYTSDGQRIRTRTRPSRIKAGQPPRASRLVMRTPPLWGHDPDAQRYELSVLVAIDRRTKTLYSASLAAIDWGEDDRGEEIFHEEEIPPPAVTGFDDPGSDSGPTGYGPGNSPEDDFSDMLDHPGEETADPDPA